MRDSKIVYNILNRKENIAPDVIQKNNCKFIHVNCKFCLTSPNHYHTRQRGWGIGAVEHKSEQFDFRAEKSILGYYQFITGQI